MAKFVNSPDGFAPLFSRAEDIITPIFWDSRGIRRRDP